MANESGPGSGRYTTYVPPKSAKRTFFEKLFKGSNSDSTAMVGTEGGAPPYLGLDQQEAIAAAATAGNEILRGTTTDGLISGDMGHFPQGVDLSFSGKNSEFQPPNTQEKAETGQWKKAGDPANAYVPDITSPGPGKTSGSDKDQDPKITSTDIKPKYVPGAPNTGTKSPSRVSGKVWEANQLGTELPKGNSGTGL
jgi:hypothetical protein